jgi:hypothetical protein
MFLSLKGGRRYAISLVQCGLCSCMTGDVIHYAGLNTAQPAQQALRGDYI